MQAGAETTFALFPWPGGVRVHIVNCIYYPPGVSLSPVQVTEWNTTTRG